MSVAAATADDRWTSIRRPAVQVVDGSSMPVTGYRSSQSRPSTRGPRNRRGKLVARDWTPRTTNRPTSVANASTRRAATAIRSAFRRNFPARRIRSRPTPQLGGAPGARRMSAGGAAGAAAHAGDDDTEPYPSLAGLFDDHHSSLLYIHINYNFRFNFSMSAT